MIKYLYFIVFFFCVGFSYAMDSDKEFDTKIQVVNIKDFEILNTQTIKNSNNPYIRSLVKSNLNQVNYMFKSSNKPKPNEDFTKANFSQTRILYPS